MINIQKIENINNNSKTIENFKTCRSQKKFPVKKSLKSKTVKKKKISKNQPKDSDYEQSPENSENSESDKDEVLIQQDFRVLPVSMPYWHCRQFWRLKSQCQIQRILIPSSSV